MKKILDIVLAINTVLFVAHLGTIHYGSKNAPTVIVEPTKVQEMVESAKAESPKPKVVTELTIEQKIEIAFGKDASVALAIAKAESGLRADAVGDTNTKYHSIGLFQIRLLPGRGITEEQMKNPDENIKYAKEMHERQGWKPWSPFNNKSYLKYLGD